MREFSWYLFLGVCLIGVGKLAIHLIFDDDSRKRFGDKDDPQLCPVCHAEMENGQCVLCWAEFGAAD